MARSASKLRQRIVKGFQFVIANSVLGPLSALVIVTLIFTIGTRGSFLSLESVQNLLSLSSLLVMTVFGSSLVILMGAIDLSAEGVIALTAVIGGLLINSERSVVDLGLLAKYDAARLLRQHRGAQASWNNA